MSKRNKLIIIGAAVLVVIIALSVGLGVGLSKPRGSIKFEAKTCNDLGVRNVVGIVNSTDELKEFFYHYYHKDDVDEDLSIQYNDNYFKNKALIIYGFTTLNKTVYKIKNVYVENGMLYLDVKDTKRKAKNELYDVRGFLIEVSKKDTAGITGVAAHINRKQPGSIWFKTESNAYGSHSDFFVLINSLEELRNSRNENGSTLEYLESNYGYDETFFKDKSLIVYQGSIYETQNHHQHALIDFHVENVYIKDGVIFLSVYILWGDAMPFESQGMWSITEIKKADIEGTTELKLDIREDMYCAR